MSKNIFKFCGLLLALAASLPAGLQADTGALSRRVAADFRNSCPEGRQDWMHYTIPPMSNIRRLADTYPSDGTACGPLRFVAAVNEYEAGSFLLWSFRDASAVKLTAGTLTGPGGTIPASALDLKIVKIWYQTGLAWYSYFADATGRQLTPELLLNDETLVQADEKKKENFLRVKMPGGRIRNLWISAPMYIYEKLNPGKILIADADSLRPFSLERAKFKQIWATLHVPAGTPEGLYTGSVKVRIDGKDAGSIPVEARILPFELPSPGTWHDLDSPFYAGGYNLINLAGYLKSCDGDAAMAETRVRNEYESFRRHNLLYPLLPSIHSQTPEKDIGALHRQFEIYKECRMGTDAVFAPIAAFPSYREMDTIRKMGMDTKIEDMPISEQWCRLMQNELSFLRNLFGQSVTIYALGWDEPMNWMIRSQRRTWKFLYDQNVKIFSSGNRRHLVHGGFNEDFIANGGSISKADADIWHAAGIRMTSYADPHTGPENPDFVRRTHGLYPYFQNSDGSFNYQISGCDWNDFIGQKNNFRSFNWIYPGTYRPVETIQFEAFREAIDDIRYMTLLKQQARRLMQSADTISRYEARAALLYLARLNPSQCDLNTVRHEVISRILELRKLK